MAQNLHHVMTSVEKSRNGVQKTMSGLHVLTYQVEIIASQMLHLESLMTDMNGS